MTEQQMLETVQYVRERLGTADVAVILGSGLGDFVHVMQNTTELSYNDIPNMPTTTVVGHAGKLISGDIKGVKVFCFAGRFHSYEGIPWEDVCFQVRMMALLGCRLYIVTNATGGLLDGMRPGCLCLLDNHFRLMARVDPLKKMDVSEHVLENSQSKTEFWNARMVELTKKVATEKNIQLFCGPYVWVSGPTFETPLEVRVAKNLGGACVGMSTVPEVVAAHAYGMSVLGLSMVSNLGAGLSANALTHEEVLESSKLSVPNLMTLLEETIARTPQVFEHFPVREERSFAFNPVSKYVFPSQFSEFRNSVVQAAESLGKVERIIVQFESEQETKLSSLSGFPANSLSGSRGKYSLKNAVLTISMGDKEGFSLEESTWIALLASVLNVQAVLVALSGVRVNETTNPIVSDIVNFTDDTRPLHYVQHLHLHKNTAGRSLLSGDGISYLACEGPSRPSSVEKHVAKEVGADAIGTTSVSLLYLLGYFGIATSAYLNESDVDVQTLLQKVDAVTPVAVNTNVDATLTGVTRGNHLVYEQVIEASEYVKKHMDGKTAKTGIIDFNLNLPLLQDSRVQVVSEISLESIPHCPIRTLKGGAKLQLVNINASSSTPSLVYVVNNLGHAYESFETNCATFVIRLFQELQVKNVYMTSSFLRTHGENQVPKDAVIALSEHFNFTGENPLIGHNENRWGDRFFDMSFVYSNEKLLPPLSHTSEQRLVAVRCLFTNNVRGLHSNTLVNNAAKTFNTQVIGDVGLFEAATVRHTVGKLDCVMLGVAFDPYDFVAQATPSESQYKQLVDVLVAQTVIEN